MIQHFNEVMAYIENHLLEDISPKQIELLAGTSEYHFRKMFSYLAGMTLTEYIKGRRFTLANEDLLKGLSVTTVAFKYGYQSVDGFSRAFKAWSGYSPSDVAVMQLQKHFSPFKFTLSITGGNTMEVNIVEKEAFNIIGVSKQVPIQFEGVNEAIMELAQTITQEQQTQMKSLGDMYPHQVLNASFEVNNNRGELLREEGDLIHVIGYASSQDNPYTNLEQFEIPALTWVVFPNTGPFPNTLQDTWARTHSEWLPSTDYELVEAPQISFTQFKEPGEDVYSEIWLAVRKKTTKRD